VVWDVGPEQADHLPGRHWGRDIAPGIPSISTPIYRLRRMTVGIAKVAKVKAGLMPVLEATAMILVHAPLSAPHPIQATAIGSSKNAWLGAHALPWASSNAVAARTGWTAARIGERKGGQNNADSCSGYDERDFVVKG
jgi:hypothetical protein